jgi:hypothetical protein
MANAPMQGGSDDSIGDFAKFGVLTISDRASTGVYEDLSGPAILGFFSEAVESKWEAVYRLVPDEQPQIEAAIIDLVSRVHLHACMGTCHACCPCGAACSTRPSCNHPLHFGDKQLHAGVLHSHGHLAPSPQRCLLASLVMTTTTLAQPGDRHSTPPPP